MLQQLRPSVFLFLFITDSQLFVDIVEICVVQQICWVSFLCSKHGPTNSKRWMRACTGRRNFSRNCLEFAMSKSRLFWKFLDWRITWRLSSLSSSSSPENGILWRSNVLLQSLTSCLQVTCDLYFALVIYKLDSGKNPSWTLVKVLINLIPTIFYTCSTTLVITNRKLETWTCSNVYYTRLRLHFETLWS